MLEILAALGASVLAGKYLKNHQTKQNNKKVELESLLNEHSSVIESFFNDIESCRNGYFCDNQIKSLKEKYKNTYESFINHSKKLNNLRLHEFITYYQNLNAYVKGWNEEYVNKELSENNSLFDDIDGRILDIQQRKAVVTDEDNNLILAGAGSGKTLTLAAKVKYLVDKKGIDPEQILLLSFTKKAADEMQTRISDRLNLHGQTKTFHKLGLDIIKDATDESPDILDENEFNKIIDNYFQEDILAYPNLINELVTFFGVYINIPRNPEEFKTLGDKIDYYRNSDFETIKSKVENKIDNLKSEKLTLGGEIVKSVEEVIIANFLYLQGVKYSYERPYPFESDDKYRKRYEPDFYLDEYDIYLEHFGITEDYKAPWLNPNDEQKYIDGISWKRDWHEKNNTTLIETYSYYNQKGILLQQLDRLLKEQGVEYHPVDYQEIYTILFLNNKDDHQFKEFKKLIGSFLNLFKSNEYGINGFEDFRMKTSDMTPFFRERTVSFLSIVSQVYKKYEKYLKDNKTIDFNDMINKAKNYVTSDRVYYPLKYIIVDEYQDISMARFKLVKALRDKSGSKLVVVGDDWQSIYRFAGSDINLFTEFSQYAGYRELIRIEKTYRNSQKLIDIASKFIEKNPRQLKKVLSSNKKNDSPVTVIGHAGNASTAINGALQRIVEKHGPTAEIMILGRNNHDIKFLQENNDFVMNKDVLKYRPYPGLKIQFLTAHRSKGLEAESVIVINMDNKLLGFPNKISDDPILSLVLTQKDDFEFAEERRLFYVALTRSKNEVYLIANDLNPSIFIKELIEDFKVPYLTIDGETIRKNPSCPKCQKGFLIVRENSDTKAKFLGCLNFPHCDYKTKHVEILDTQIKCNTCGSYMIKKHGSRGEFFGCLNYPNCKHKLELDEASLIIESNKSRNGGELKTITTEIEAFRPEMFSKGEDNVLKDRLNKAFDQKGEMNTSPPANMETTIILKQTTTRKEAHLNYESPNTVEHVCLEIEQLPKEKKTTKASEKARKKLKCIDCGVDFSLTQGEFEFYRSKGLTMPRRCQSCREANKNNPYKDLDAITKHLGTKNNSFVKNAKTFGLPVDVSGGLSIEYIYVIEILKDINGATKKGYYLSDSKTHHGRIVGKLSNATLFRDKRNAIDVVNDLKTNERVVDAKVIPFSYYEEGWQWKG